MSFSAAPGVPPSAKYEANRTGTPGPALKNMFDVTRQRLPATEILRLLDMVILNVLCANTDAHAKNYAIMIRGNGATLAPAYDIMCGEVWGSVTKNLAQKIAGRSRGDDLNAADWQRFARECGLNPKQVAGRVAELAKAAVKEAEKATAEVAAMPAGPHDVLKPVREAVERRACALLTRLQEPADEAAAQKATA
jgi:serine/threonine-protein kinase HipA